MIAFAALMAVSGCGREPDIVGIVRSYINVEALPNLEDHGIFILTTRAASALPGEFFSSDRAPNLSLASVDDTIPPTHMVGELERPTEIPPDPITDFTVINPAIYASDDAFVGAINTALAKLPPQDRRLLLFVHGYINTTSDAILRFAQFI